MRSSSTAHALVPRVHGQSRARRAGSFLLGFAALLASGASAAAPSRTILYNGKIFTANPQKPFVQAISVTDDKIQAVGTTPAMLALARPSTHLVDLHGRAVVPGLNDAHVHVLTPPGTYLDSPAFIPGPGPTLPEVLGLVSAAASATPPGTWLLVLVGTNITDDVDANRFALDTVSPDHPVKLEVWTGHGTYLNTKAMETLGIAEQEPDPVGGHYERVDGTQILTGEAHEYAEFQVRRKQYAAMTDAEAIGHYTAFASQALALGFTSLQDMAVGMPHARALDILEAANLPLRVRGICFPLSLNEPCDFNRASIASAPRITSAGIKWITDGTPIERLAFLTEPYLDRPDTMGALDFPTSKIDGMLLRGLLGPRVSHQTLFHAVGDGAIDSVLDGMDALGGHFFWKGRRARIEHGDLLFPENYGRMLDLGAVIVQNPTHFALTSLFAQRLQPETVSKMEPLRTLLDLGVPLALGTDGIGNVQSPWVDIFLATVHPTRPTEAITVEQAITAYTTGSAYAEFEEDRKGMIAAGMEADLAVLSQDVFTVPLGALPATSSVLTMVAGKIAWQAPSAP